jgi:hypothetical protein
MQLLKIEITGHGYVGMAHMDFLKLWFIPFKSFIEL